MSDNKRSRRGGQGYYIALILCAAAIGITGYVYYRNANQAEPASVEETVGEVPALIEDGVDVPVIASCGAGCMADFVTLFQTLPKVDAGLAASIFHFGQVKIPELKQLLKENNIPVRL